MAHPQNPYGVFGVSIGYPIVVFLKSPVATIIIFFELIWPIYLWVDSCFFYCCNKGVNHFCCILW